MGEAFKIEIKKTDSFEFSISIGPSDEPDIDEMTVEELEAYQAMLQEQLDELEEQEPEDEESDEYEEWSDKYEELESLLDDIADKLEELEDEEEGE